MTSGMRTETDARETVGPAGLDRRKFLLLGAGAFAVASTPLAWRRRDRLIGRRIPVMGTVAEVAVVLPDESRAQEAIDAAFRELRWVERTMSRFRADSDVGRANGAPSGRAVTVTPETGTVLRESIRWARATEGRFDPCLGRSSALWAIGDRREPPPPEAVRRLAGRGLYGALEVDHGWAAGPTVRLHDPRAAIDLGGIAKGYAVDRAVRALRAHGVDRGLVNAGGDLYALGRSADGDPWKVGVRSPHHPSGLATTLRVSDRAVATSGDYLAFFEHSGRRYHHLLDPGTGAPRTSRMRSLTTAASSCMAADAAATALFGLCEDPGEALRRLDARVEVVHLIRDRHA